MKEKMKNPGYALRLLFGFFTIACFVTAFVMPDLKDALAGIGRICTRSGQTVKSYFDATYGGLAGTFLNAGLVCLVMTLMFCLPGAKPDGVSALAFFLTAGFSFWGITILNIWFSFAGVALYCLVKKKSFGAMANAALFSTGLAPLITEMLFRYPAEDFHGFTLGGVILALAVGVFIGFILPAGLAHAPKMHKGFDLYNAAVPIGLTAFFLRALLYKVFLPAPPDSVAVGTGDSFWNICNIFCLVIFAVAVIWGLAMGGDRQYGKLLEDSGHNADFFETYGAPAAVLNFGFFGIAILIYYNLVGAKWNAATFGCVFCMVSCFAKGSHPRNVLPIMLGYIGATFGAKYVCDCIGTDFTLAVNAQAVVIGLCFANGLSPVSGEYGWLAGLIAGVLHYIMVSCVPVVHGSFLLYNGGFTAALVCFLYVPVLEHFFKTKTEKKAAKEAAEKKAAEEQAARKQAAEEQMAEQ